MRIAPAPISRLASFGPLLLVLAADVACADGVVVDRVYDPYVHPLETEIEWRSIVQFDDEDPDVDKHAIGVGRSLSDRWAIEVYAVGIRSGDESLRPDAYEVELKRQLTEQGEYAFDWGALLEVERTADDDIWEVAASIMAARDVGRWTGTMNLGLIYEWGSGVQNEVESELRLQTRYRLRESVEPALELHIGQDVAVIGPTLSGLVRLAPGKKFRWDAGAFWAANERSPDRVFRLNLEYEF